MVIADLGSLDAKGYALQLRIPAAQSLVGPTVVWQAVCGLAGTGVRFHRFALATRRRSADQWRRVPFRRVSPNATYDPRAMTTDTLPSYSMQMLNGRAATRTTK